MDFWAYYVLTVLSGALAGAAAGYFSSKYTDKRRRNEAKQDLKKSFENISKTMPELIKEMKNDVGNPEFTLARELVILQNKNVQFNNTKRMFIYYEEEHNELVNKIKILEEHGFIRQTDFTNIPIYRFSEDFRELLLNS